jgi:leader peptidase (prepilin peptidase)/N-methyltransferase
MMQTQALDTTGRDESTRSSAGSASRTVRSAVGASSPLALGIASATVVAASCSSLSSLVPLAAAIPVALLVAPALIDVLDRQLPNRMVAVAALIGGVVAALTVIVGGEIDLRGAAIGAAAFAGPLLVMHLIAPTSMGFGDVKVACVLGAAVGIVHPFYGLLALATGSLLGAVAGLVRRRRTIAFGPALVAGAVIALLLAAAPVDVFEVTTQYTDGHPSEAAR